MPEPTQIEILDRFLEDHYLKCEVEGSDEDFAEMISIGVFDKEGVERLQLCSLPCATDACDFGEDNTVDYNRDQEQRSLGYLFAGSLELLKACHFALSVLRSHGIFDASDRIAESKLVNAIHYAGTGETMWGEAI